MTLQAAQIAPVWTPPPPGAQATNDVDFVMGANGVRHVDDPSKEGRRYFEGWAQLKGIDMQEMELAADACQKAAATYLKRNPVIVWNHQPNLPIGRVLSLTFTSDGMYMSGIIYDMSDVLKRWKKHSKKIPLDSIALKCEEVWAGIKSGAFRKLSVRGGVRQVAHAFSPELQKQIPRVTEVNIYEISVAPISIHPGTDITAINTIAKGLGEALDISKGLPALQVKEKTMDVKEAWEQFQATLKANADDNGTIELPEEVTKGLQAYGNALVPEEQEIPALEEPPVEGEPPPVQTDNHQLAALIRTEISKGLEPLQAQNQQLQEEIDQLKGQPDGRRGRVSLQTPTTAKVKPDGAPNKPGAIQKALDAASTTILGRTEYGEGDRHRMSTLDVFKLALIDAEREGHMRCGKVNLSPGAQTLIGQLMA